MHRRSLSFALLATLAAAACSDRPTAPTTTDVPDEFLETARAISENYGAFHWLRPIVDDLSSSGVADGSLHPTVEVCFRNAAGDGCSEGPSLASFTRDSGDPEDRVVVDDKDEYFVMWRMNTYPPDRDGTYRIRVLLGEQEVGHADVIALRNREIRSYSQTSDGDLLPVSDNGAFKIAFRLEEGILEQLVCDFDQDQDFEDCQAEEEVAGDGEPTTVSVSATNGAGEEVVAAVVTAPDGVFVDENGNPIPGVVIAVEVELLPPSEDVFTDNSLELPFFVEVNTFPGNVFIDPDGPGVAVVICQDAPELAARGIGDPLHPQLILYKVSDPLPGFPDGLTRRLETVPGAEECAGFVPPIEAPEGLVGMLRHGLKRAVGLFAPQPLRARRLHGGLNTVITRDSGLEEPFSTFGAALGPAADSSFAIVPDGVVDEPTPMLVQIRNALGGTFPFGGDEVAGSVVGGPNAGAPVSVVDNGDGTYAAAYTPTAPGSDTIQFTLTRSDGWFLGTIGGTSYVSFVSSAVDPAQSTAIVESGDVGAPVTLLVQVRDGDGADVGEGGNDVAMTVASGPNAGTPVTVTDNGDGTYTGQYQPTTFGLDDVAVTLEGTPISGSPYAAPVSSIPVQWSAGQGGNDHWYQLIVVDPAAPPTWTAARDAAATRFFEGNAGHLVSMNSGAEQSFVFSTFAPPFISWIGVADDDVDGVYDWVTGERVHELGGAGCIAPFCNWVTGEPNNNGGIELYGEMWEAGVPEAGGWNDLPNDGTGRIGGYFVEYDDEPIATVGTYADVNGIVGTAVAFQASAQTVVATSPSEASTQCGLYQPAGIHPDRSVCWEFLAPSTGMYEITTPPGGGYSAVDAGYQIPLAEIDDVLWAPSEITVNFTGDPVRHRSFLVRVFGGDQGIVGEALVSVSSLVAGQGAVTLSDLSLTEGVDYQVNVFAFNADLTTAARLPEPFAATASAHVPFQVPTAAPDGAVQWSVDAEGNGNWYLYQTGDLLWTQAREASETLSAFGEPGHLVTITSQEESDFLFGLRLQLGLEDWRPWIGLTDEAVEGTFTWVTGEPLVFTNWADGEPNNAAGIEDYVEMFASMVWNDRGDGPLPPFGWIVEFEAPEFPIRLGPN